MPQFIVKTLQSLENPLAAELKALGAKNVETVNRGASCTMDWDTLYKVHIYSRLAIRCIQPIAEFEAEDEKEFYHKARNIRYERFMGKNDTLLVQSVVRSKTFTHSHFIGLRLKDAICDRFRHRTGKRPSVDKERPNAYFVLTIYENSIQIALDATGPSMHKRGYKQDQGPAPLSEVLAAGLLSLSNWKPGVPLVDGMTGSGTFITEALMQCQNMPAAKYRDNFAMMQWRSFDRKRWDELMEEALAKETTEGYPDVVGIEIDKAQVRCAKANLVAAGFSPIHHLREMDFFSFRPAMHNREWERGVVVLNPPYDERLKRDDIASLYSRIGDHLKTHFTGWDAWIVTGSRLAMKHIGLRTERRIDVMNGKLPCTYLHYPLYKGSKK